MNLTGREYWDFLDDFDGNALYFYANGANCGDNSLRFYNTTPEEAKKTMFYLFWFVFRYVLDCKTYEEAVKRSDDETLRAYNLSCFIEKNRVNYTSESKCEMFIGNGEIGAISLSSSFEGIKKASQEQRDSLKKQAIVRTILQILYNRYNILEQIECFARCNDEQTKETNRHKSTRYVQAMELRDKYLQMMQGKPQYKGLIEQYYKTFPPKKGKRCG